jgi:hypothetical protein
MYAKPTSFGTKLWYFVSSPHPYMLLSMALGVFMNDAQFPKESMHWVIDAQLISSGFALAFIQWKADPNASLVPAGNAVIPPRVS